MKTLKMKFSKTALLLFGIAALSSCSNDDADDPTIPLEQLAALEIDCSTPLAAGETFTLENRNDGIDYIINCVYGTYGDFILDPGVTIQFGTNAGITVYEGGSIQALGTAVDQVVFTGEDKTPGAWKGIFIDSNDLKNKIEYATIEYAGGEAFNSNADKGGVIVYNDTHLNMNNTTITQSETYGLNAIYGGCELTLENNTITNCVVPMLVLPNYVDGIVGGNYTGNDTDAIHLDSGIVNIDATYRDLGVPYHVLARLVVIAGGGKLTINPGVELEFGLNGSLEINEGASGSTPSLVAVGTAANPILFTSIDKVEGAWKGIYFDSPSAINEIGFATIEYASNLDQDGAIFTWASTVLNVHDVLFKDIAKCAIQYYGPEGITMSNLTYDNVANEVCEY